jgi:hypothetical protein
MALMLYGPDISGMRHPMCMCVCRGRGTSGSLRMIPCMYGACCVPPVSVSAVTLVLLPPLQGPECQGRLRQLGSVSGLCCIVQYAAYLSCFRHSYGTRSYFVSLAGVGLNGCTSCTSLRLLPADAMLSCMMLQHDIAAVHSTSAVQSARVHRAAWRIALLPSLCWQML